jgi:hypothetical protein
MRIKARNALPSNQIDFSIGYYFCVRLISYGTKRLTCQLVIWHKLMTLEKEEK